MRMTISVTLPEFWLLVSKPAREFSEKLLLAEPKFVLTYVTPKPMKSPIWEVPRRPTKLVKSVSCTRLEPCTARTGSLTRDSSTVASYLSEAKSHWTPLKRERLKVSGVRVVRM